MASSFFSQLVAASWRGIPFSFVGGELRVGRRQAVHEYPNKEEVWVEDMGRATRRITMTGFLVGDDVINQRERMVNVCEQYGRGVLYHPSLGRLWVSLLEAPMRESREAGRVIEISFVFLESGERDFPTLRPAAGQAVTTSALKMIQAAVGGFIADIKAAISMGSAVVHQVEDTVTGFCAQVSNLVKDATSLFSMVTSLPSDVGNTFGRYFGGGLVGFSNVGTPSTPTGATLDTLIASGAASRAAVAAAVVDLGTAAAAADPNAIATAVQGLTAALLAAIVDPADAVRILTELYGYTEAPVAGTSAVPQAMLSAQSACLALFRRATLQALASASSAYQPSSADDAASVRNAVLDVIDQEITEAGDTGDDDSFSTLRALRAAVSQDLTSRGAGLPAIVNISTPAPLPALVLAQQLYRDASRADQLLVFGNPPHPAFMPTSFKALAS